ncbi:MAG: hypothetical protein FWH17_07465 [Oscillospiraceae bacterium]|nr:hypothetical protein [Oscillospiraceae bacterium]
MKTELQPIEAANLPNAILPPLSQTGDKNTQIAQAEVVNIYNNTELQINTDVQPSLNFGFGVSFAAKNIKIDVITEDGIRRAFEGDYCICEADEWTTETKNQIMKWYVQGQKEPFMVLVEDKRIAHIKSLLADIEEKLAVNEELILEEQIRYNNLGILIQAVDSERRAKEKAITVYLKDRLFQAYCHVGFYTDLLDMIGEILNFPYRRGGSRGAEYREMFKSFDVYTSTVKKEYRGQFVVDLLVADVKDAFNRDALLQFPGSFVCDWGLEMAKKIAVQYYVQYIGRQIIDHERPILETDEYLNDSNTSIESWRIGPH